MNIDQYLSAPELEEMTGTPASTWRYWADGLGSGPASFKLGQASPLEKVDRAGMAQSLETARPFGAQKEPPRAGRGGHDRNHSVLPVYRTCTGSRPRPAHFRPGRRIDLVCRV